jgi:1-aminocyclopropane-1-carboxylate deaminase
MKESLENIIIQPLPSFSNENVRTDILRLDGVHPVISGNKWFKLKYYLQEAITSGKSHIASFGGAYSNHIVAAAFAAKAAGMGSTGFIRGERPAQLSNTLQDAIKYGMDLVFVDRGLYQKKEMIIQAEAKHHFYWIMEGGFGIPGAIGAAEILATADTTKYSHILCAAATGTMMAGLIKASQPQQEVTGISVLKNNMSLAGDVNSLLSNEEKKKKYSLLHQYHFGGYAKHPEELISFMKQLWFTEKLPTDIVYTSKLLFAAKDLISKGYFPAGGRVLLIHSGGLQGNRSLPYNRLPF